MKEGVRRTFLAQNQNQNLNGGNQSILVPLDKNVAPKFGTQYKIKIGIDGRLWHV